MVLKWCVYLLLYLYFYLFASLKNRPFHFQALGRLRQPNMILVFFVL